MGEASAQPHEDRRLTYKAYTAYSRFIHHLYEFVLGAVAREQGSTAKIEGAAAEALVLTHARRILRARRNAILNKTAPQWENVSANFPEEAPVDFARDFRRLRKNRRACVPRATDD